MADAKCSNAQPGRAGRPYAGSETVAQLEVLVERPLPVGRSGRPKQGEQWGKCPWFSPRKQYKLAL